MIGGWCRLNRLLRRPCLAGYQKKISFVFRQARPTVPSIHLCGMTLCHMIRSHVTCVIMFGFILGLSPWGQTKVYLTIMYWGLMHQSSFVSRQKSQLTLWWVADETHTHRHTHTHTISHFASSTSLSHTHTHVNTHTQAHTQRKAHNTA